MPGAWVQTVTKTKVRKAGMALYTELPEDIQDDLISVLAGLTEEDDDEVRVGLENGPAVLPLVWVKAADIHDPNQRVSELAVESYAVALKAGDQFPPVIIDSSKAPILALEEGRHRTAAAVLASVPEILAIDVAGARIVEREGVETYAFGKGAGRGARSHGKAT